MPTHRTGLLIIRAWVEEGSQEPLRAHVRVSDDISSGIEREVALVHLDTVMELVDAWLHGIVDEPASDTDG
jgi:hypothetical protein